MMKTKKMNGNTLQCNHCHYQGSIHNFDGITISEAKELDKACITKGIKPFSQMTNYKGLCPICMSLDIKEINN